MNGYLSGLKTLKCYCGGWVVWRRKIDKRFKSGWKWEIANCYSTKPDEESIYNERLSRTY